MGSRSYNSDDPYLGNTYQPRITEGQVVKPKQSTDEERAKTDLAIQDFDLLTTPNVVGFYKECELIHVFLSSKEKRKLYHYFAVANFEEFIEPDSTLRDQNITTKLQEISLDFSLGIVKKRLSLDDVRKVLVGLAQGSMSVAGQPFELPVAMQLLPKIHVPSLWGYEGVPISQVLKPNLWGDRYVIECVAIANPFQDVLSPIEIAQIDEIIKSLIPINLSLLPDKVGSTIFEFPITILSAGAHISKDWTHASIEMTGDVDSINAQNVISIITTKLDGNVTGTSTHEGTTAGEEFTIGDSNNLELRVYNKGNDVIFHHSMVNFIRGFNMSMSIGRSNSEPRTYLDLDGTEVTVELFERGPSTRESIVQYDSRTRKRIYQNEIHERSGRFLSVRKGDRDKAVAFIRQQLYDFSGNATEVWLWDPYLQCQDIFDTLYHIAIRNIRFKCITSVAKKKERLEDVKEISRLKLVKLFCESFRPKNTEKSRFEEFKASQRETFIQKSNNLGVQLEFRACHDNIGFDFHDRFLFFIPESIDELPTVFSLGTSINSLGKSHHLMQQTLDPRNIVAAFEELWKMLDRDDARIITLPGDLK